MRRLLQILWVVFSYRLDAFIDRDDIPWFLTLLLWPFTLKPEPKQPREVRLRLALERLGPIFIKFGQLLSTRKDLLDDDLASELAKLQDDVAPFDSQHATAIIEKALKAPVTEVFSSFDQEPLASASIAQVHTATLLTGQDVVIKVVRPNLEKTIQKDIRLLRFIAMAITKLHPEGKRLRPLELVEDYRHTILDELDLKREAANTSQLRRNFLGSGLIYVPEVYWDYSNQDILVMERIHGIPVTDMEALKAEGVNLRKLAERGVEIFFTQVFRDSFFHADMHPGNIFVSYGTPDNPEYIAIDCAIIGSLSEFDQYYLARNLLAIFQRDYRLVAELHVQCGWVPAKTKVTDFEAAIRSVCEPIFEKPLGEISFGQLLLYLFQTARRFEMEVQPSLVLLQKTLLNIEGLGRQLYPALDLWATAQPFLEDWVKNRYSPKAVLKQLQRHAPGWLEHLPQIPDLVFDKLSHAPATHPQAISETDKLLIKNLKSQQRISAATLMVISVSAIFFFYQTYISL
ncbi:MAG: ubiquinone biosynthesis regulatory protein kinase UbiB [Pseudomonadales bacterium]|nr:ubiquinone biosynthesis regulatory protein kinase UbiB [Pseudomonadales bacterium]